jgi:hypothetical protein
MSVGSARRLKGSQDAMTMGQLMLLPECSEYMTTLTGRTETLTTVPQKPSARSAAISHIGRWLTFSVALAHTTATLSLG